MESSILRLHNLSKTFPGQIALDSVDLSVNEGIVHALLGQNGSGKSTLIKLLSGFEKPDFGYKAFLNQQKTDLWYDRNTNKKFIRIVHQDLGLVQNLNTIENLALGRGYHTNFLGTINWNKEGVRAQDLLEDLGIVPDVRKPVGLLSRAEQTYISIARALQGWEDYSRGLLILDEPTASLQFDEISSLFKTIRMIQNKGAGILYVSHRLDEIFEIANYVTILNDGKKIYSNEISERNKPNIVKLLTKKDTVSKNILKNKPGKKVILECDSIYSHKLKGVDFKLYEKEILGVAGLIGSGRDELGSVIFGANPRFSGKVLIEKEIVFADPKDSIIKGIGYLPSDRKTLGLIERHRLFEHITLPLIRKNTNIFGHIDRKKEIQDVKYWSNLVNLKPPDLFQRMHKFSGGNQQKAVIARWLRMKPKVLILDDPSQGVDMESKNILYDLILKATKNGTSIIMCSSDPSELCRLCNRVIVLKAGIKVADFSGKQLTLEKIESESIGTSNNRRGMRIHQHDVTTELIR